MGEAERLESALGLRPVAGPSLLSWRLLAFRAARCRLYLEKFGLAF